MGQIARSSPTTYTECRKFLLVLVFWVLINVARVGGRYVRGKSADSSMQMGSA
jgi:hypothetical protein